MDSQHLDNDALLRVLYGVGSREESGHAASCDSCATVVASLGSRRAIASPEMPESFWRRRAETILAGARPATTLRWALAGSVAVVLVAAVLTGGAPPARPLYTAADDRLLRDIHQTISSIEPQALAPATLLVPRQIQEVRP